MIVKKIRYAVHFVAEITGLWARFSDGSVDIFGERGRKIAEEKCRDAEISPSRRC
jgi:hypothetical protein